MRPTPNTRPRHALRWVLGVAFALAVVVGTSLQMARRRALERWDSVVTPWEEEWQRSGFVMHGGRQAVEWATTGFLFETETRGGNVFRAWREDQWEGQTIAQTFTLVLRQERNFFGSSIEARLSGGAPRLEEIVRTSFAEVDVELVVEP